MTRATQRRNLKEKRKELLVEIGLSMSAFKRKMPRVTKRGKDFDVVDEAMLRADPMKRGKKGKKPSLQQQVTWLGYLKEATEDLREEFGEMVRKAEKNKEELTEEEMKSNLPSFQSL